jgi:hypothetical protein
VHSCATAAQPSRHRTRVPERRAKFLLESPAEGESLME